MEKSDEFMFRIKVKDEEQSKEIQEILFGLGSGQKQFTSYPDIYTIEISKEGFITYTPKLKKNEKKYEDFFKKYKYKWITLEKLKNENFQKTLKEIYLLREL